MSASQRSAAPWWAPGGAGAEAEACPCCFGFYAYEIEVRCADCDKPMCPLCAVSGRRIEVHVCVECGAEETAG
jgi:hypothetical protein